MRARGSYQPKKRSANLADYEIAFVGHAHRLLALGYARLARGDFAVAEEETITGCLVGEIEAVLDDPGRRRWTRWLSIHEEARIHDPKRTGKKRRRLDIRIESAERLPRSRLAFEAKRLGPGHPVSGYLGDEGLGCFLAGSYAREQRIAGMLGYVQAGEPQDWAEKIERAMVRDPHKVRLLPGGVWRQERLVRELEHTFRSGHSRPAVGTNLEVFHTLLVLN